MGGIKHNQFGLNINPQYRTSKPRVNCSFNFDSSYNTGDLRNKYSVTSQRNAFSSYLNKEYGMTLQQFQQAKWEAEMKAKEQQSAANQEAISSTFTNLGNIITTGKGLWDSVGKGLFNTIKGWFGK